MGCFSTILAIIGAIFVLVSMIRWFEQASEAVQLGWWNKIFVLLACPFAVWLFPSRIAAGRPFPVPHHEPVRGFGSMPKPPPAKPQAAIEPDKFAKLRQKMREQGMLPPEE
jgi:hypothetical protein